MVTPQPPAASRRVHTEPNWLKISGRFDFHIKIEKILKQRVLQYCIFVGSNGNGIGLP